MKKISHILLYSTLATSLLTACSDSDWFDGGFSGDRQKIELTGDIDQVPPTYSACKIEGKRAYKMRRDGEQVELKPKHIHIDSITLTSFDAGKGQMSIDVVCGKGTYIRALARDIGRALNSGAYLTSLRRTRVGDITVSDCISFDHFDEWLNGIK